MYFCLLTSGVLILDRVSKCDFHCVAVYNIPLCSPASVAYIKDVMLGRDSKGCKSCVGSGQEKFLPGNVGWKTSAECDGIESNEG